MLTQQVLNLKRNNCLFSPIIQIKGHAHYTKKWFNIIQQLFLMCWTAGLLLMLFQTAWPTSNLTMFSQSKKKNILFVYSGDKISAIWHNFDRLNNGFLPDLWAISGFHHNMKKVNGCQPCACYVMGSLSGQSYIVTVGTCELPDVNRI